MKAKQHPSPLKLSTGEKFSILKPYISDRFMDQFRSIWLIITYLILFQLLVLRLPLVDALMIGAGIVTVLIGLMIFMEGLLLGLMPFGETIGATLPRKAGLTVILAFAFLLGLVATFAEPAIATLQLAGRTIDPATAPLLYSLLNEFSGQLVIAVGAGVGIAVIFGVLRFLYSWSLKIMIIPLVTLLGALTLFAHFNEILKPVIGLAWDCGAVTTGPVTVPLVLALGIGVSRIVSGSGSGGSGFGIVTLASLFPILAVLLLSLAHIGFDDYYGRPNSKVSAETNSNVPLEKQNTIIDTEENRRFVGFTEEEYLSFKKSGILPENAFITYEGDKSFEDGAIIIKNTIMVITKKRTVISDFKEVRIWDSGITFLNKLVDSTKDGARAILPLCLFLFFVLKFVLREKIKRADEIALGILFALIGMTLFTLGIHLALDPLGSQVGKNISSTFDSIIPYGMERYHGPLFDSKIAGQVVVIVFAFLLGYSATLAEPALNALGVTVEKITVGAFRKALLMQAVGIGVGVGIAAGIAKMIFALSLTWILIPPYLLLLFLTLLSTEEFVNIAWDSAGVTTGPITVPLVLAMGLGVGASVNAPAGFGVLAMASVCPILSVLIVGLVVKKKRPEDPDPEPAIKEI